MDSSPAVLLLHWWAPLHFKSSFWNVAEDELDTIGSYYDLQVTHSFPSPITYAGLPEKGHLISWKRKCSYATAFKVSFYVFSRAFMAQEASAVRSV